MLRDLIHFDKLGSNYDLLSKDLEDDIPLGIVSPTGAQKIHFAGFNPYFTVYVTQDRITARKVVSSINEFLGENGSVMLPEREDILLHRHLSSNSVVYERVSALAKILERETKVLVMPVDSLLQYYPNKDLFRNLIVKLRKGDTINIDKLINRLVASNYIREDRINDKGSFSIRGDILEIFPVQYDMPFRISIFDDTIEFIKIFEPESMLSTGEVEEILIVPATDILIPKGICADALGNINRFMQNENAKLRTDEIISDIESILSLHSSSPSLVWLIPFIRKYMSTVWDYIPKDSVIIFDEPRNIDDRAKLIIKEHHSRLQRLIREGENLEAHKTSLIEPTQAYENCKRYKLVNYQIFTASNPIYEVKSIHKFNGKAISSYYLDFSMLVTDLKIFLNRGNRIVICCGNREKADNLATNLRKEEIGVKFYDDLPIDFKGIALLPNRISNGLIFPDNSLVIIGTNEVFRASEKRIKASKRRSTFTMPKEGDYVVHETHGIGKCEGIVTLSDTNGTKDYLLIKYRDQDKLYVPIDQLDLVERYSGSDSKPRLSKIGGNEFERIKSAVKKSVKKLAIDLIDVYGKRERNEGVKYTPDTPWQIQFEDDFPYEETIDQIEAVKEAKQDMESGKIMDRLICGDVGYGKTEVALRIIFKTIMNGYQAAILAPTTILAEQHYATAKNRFAAYGIRCAVLSRFLSANDIKKTLKELKMGDIDVIISTHRLLSKDVEFKKLGLLVLDEEQRFGVEHKEKIKALKTNINVLTLTATPIPRTLNMALTGVRDISILESPPEGRLPVATYVTEYTDALVTDACNRELSRGGQVIILYNKVATIDQFANRIRRLVPNASIEIAHGQMTDVRLEQAIGNIYEKRADILICSTIIENGIDLPNANTLIVYDSDMLGLTELYQLRGRVGRRDRLATAYFTVREGRILTKDATSRLQALTEYTDFGSGFKIAMKDLEIRGAGNILGREQHGHMMKVGYEMYCKLLDEAVRQLKGDVIVSNKETEVNISIDAFLSEKIAGGAENKMRIYKRIADIRNLEDRDNVIKELEDILIKIDNPLKNLVDISLIRALSSQIGIKKVVITNKISQLIFSDIEKIKAQDTLYAISLLSNELYLTNSMPPSVIFNADKNTIRLKMDKVINFLIKANGIY